MTVLADVTNGWGAVATGTAVVGGIITLYMQGRSAKHAATTAAGLAAVTKTTVEATKTTAERTQSIISNVATSLDAATTAGLLADASKLLTTATAQLARCEDENRQLVALVKSLERKVDGHERELAGFRAAFDNMHQSSQPTTRRAPRKQS